MHAELARANGPQYRDLTFPFVFREETMKKMAILFVMLFLLAPQLNAVADGNDPAERVFKTIAGKTVGVVLDEMQAKLNVIEQSLSIETSLTTGNFVYVLQAAMKGAIAQFDNERTSLVNDIDHERALSLADLQYNVDQLLQYNVPRTVAATKVSVLEVLNHVSPLIAKQTPFMVALIDPIVIQYHESSPYQVKVLGIGIGNKEGIDYQTKVVATFPGIGPVPLQVSNTTDGIKFTLPRDKIDNLLNVRAATRIPVTIASTVPGHCFWVFGACEKHYEFPFEITAFPRVALVVRVTQSTTKDIVDPATEKFFADGHATLVGRGAEGGDWVLDTYPLNADDGWLITRVTDKNGGRGYCEDGVPGNDGCRFVYPSPESYPSDPVPSIKVHGRNNGPSANMYFKVFEAKKDKGLVPLPSAEYEMSAGETRDLIFHSDATYIRLEVVPVVGKNTIVRVLPSNQRSTDLVLCGGPQPIGSKQTAWTCTAKDISGF